MYDVYILESELDGDFYKGSTSNYVERFEQHNRGESRFTRTKLPWRLIYVQVFGTRREALIQEKRLKRCNKEYLRWLVLQPFNILLAK